MLRAAVPRKKYRPAAEFQAQPASGEDMEEMAAGKDQHIAVDGPEPLDDAVSGRGATSVTDSTARTTVPEIAPSRGDADESRRSALAFVGHVIPFDEARVCTAATAPKPASSQVREGPPQRAGEHAGEKRQAL